MREYQRLEVVVDGVEVGVRVVRLRRIGCDPEGPGEKGETRVGRKRIHRIRAPGFGYHFRFRVGRVTGRTAQNERERDRERMCGNVIRKERVGREWALWPMCEGCVLAPDLLTILQSCPCRNGFSTGLLGLLHNFKQGTVVVLRSQIPIMPFTYRIQNEHSWIYAVFFKFNFKILFLLV